MQRIGHFNPYLFKKKQISMCFFKTGIKNIFSFEVIIGNREVIINMLKHTIV